MVSQDKIRYKMTIIESNLTKLLVLQGFSLTDFLGDFRNVESAKHLLQVSIETMGDICDHIIAKNRLGTPDSLADSFATLARNGYISRENADTYTVMARFRNKVVHLYQEINDEEIYKILQNNLKDFTLFLAEISKLM